MLVIVPASGDEAYEHFRKTIEKEWSVNELLSLGVELPADVVKRLQSVGRFGIWGSLPSVVGIDRAWQNIDNGWVVAFYRRGRIVCYGTTFAKIRSSELAEKLWGKNAEGRTWEYIYFIRDINWTNIPWELVRDELEYKIDPPRGHLFVDSDKVDKIVKKYGSVVNFFKSLERRISTTNSNTRAQYRGEELFLPTLGRQILGRITKIDDPYEATLYLYGASLKKIFEHMGLGVVKREIFEGLMPGESSEHVARLYNDLRRLCLVSLGHKGDWQRGVPAKITEFSMTLAKAVAMLKELGVEVNEVELGALAVVFCLVGNARGCVDEEAGVCIKLAREGVESLSQPTKEVVAKARSILEAKPELLFLVMGYGTKIKG